MNFDESGQRTLTAPGLRLEVALVPWDAQAFGFSVAQVDVIEVAPHADPTPVLAQFVSWLDERDVRLVSCRLDSLKLRESMLLEGLGFRFVEMVYSPVLTPLRTDWVSDEELVIEPAQPQDRPALEAMASSVFTTGRHVLDWRLDRSAGHERYRRWLAGALDGDGQDVLMASIGDEVVGFFIVEALPDDCVYWHLTAVAAKWQGKGVGKRVWRAMIERHRAAGVRRIETTISAHNIAVINLYAGLGFRFTAPQATFHWLR